MSEIVQAYHFVGATLRNGQPVPPDGEWLEYDGPLPIIMCERGLHASVHPFDAIRYAPGNTLCRVELAGTVLTDTDKLVATRRRILTRRDATPILRAFARRCALDVIHLWDCPVVVKDYLETGDESLRAAAWAAWAETMAGAAAWAKAAAWAAAWAWAEAAEAARAARAGAVWAGAEKYRGWFAEMVEALFREA